jgi:biopolymer transport protein ExbB/TolQ
MQARTKRRLLIAGVMLGAVMMLSPFVGMVGTVLGMHHAFEAVAAKPHAGDPAQLSEAIGETLISTAVGIVVAIPGFLLFVTSLVLLLIHRRKQTATPPPVPHAPTHESLGQP